MSSDAISINATVVRGLGAAEGTLCLQIPMLKQYVPGIEKCHYGSVNLRLDKPLRVLNPDVTSPPLAWHPAYPTFQEVFSFVKIEFEYPLRGACHIDWIYIPHASPHFNNIMFVEIIAEKIPDLNASERCCVHIPKPYQLEPVIVV